jgi:glycosyltransferase involved in cell wall biosynthesis
MLCAIEMSVHKMFGWYEKNVDVFIAPSRFLMAKVKEWRTPIKKIVVLPNFVNSLTEPSVTPGEYYLFFGRLSEEKGVPLLLSAMRGVNFPLRIVGTGPIEAQLRKFTDDNGLTQVHFLGFRSGDELTALIRGARAVIVPSLWYENCPLVIQEAYQQGRPVIATNLGGMKEFVVDGETGRLFARGSVEQLKNILIKLSLEPELAQLYGQKAYTYGKQFQAEDYYQHLIELYGSLVQK